MARLYSGARLLAAGLRTLVAITALAVGLADGAPAADLRVMSSVAIQRAYDELVPPFAKASGHTVITEWTPTALMMLRLRAGEAPDLVIMASNGIDELIAAGKFQAGSRVDIASSGIGVAVRKGAAKPDIGSTAAVVAALQAAPSIAYSTGPSGVYLDGLVASLGLTDVVKPKLKLVQGEPVGAVVARGDAAIGFQQVPELLPEPGIEVVGTLPAEIQQITMFSAGLPTGAANADAAKAWIAFLTSPAAGPVFKKTGLEPRS